MLKDIKRCWKTLHFDCLPWLLELGQGGNAVKVPCYVSIVNRAVMLCHLKGGVPQQFLKGEGVAAAIDKILAGEGMAKHMNGSL